MTDVIEQQAAWPQLQTDLDHANALGAQGPSRVDDVREQRAPAEPV